MVEVLVLFNYDGQESDELTIRKGDVIREVVKQGGGWWEGLLGSRRGVFPDNFVTVVTEAEMNNSTATSSSSAAVSRAGKGKMCKALFDYSPVHEDELALKVGEEIVFLEEVEEGWWRGKLGQKEGVFPSNFVMMLEDSNSSTGKPNGNSTTSAVDNHSAPSPEVAPELPPKPVKELAKVLFSYSATQIDELELREGDIVTILSKDCEDKGWWKGKLNNKIGVFPDNFVELIPQNQNGIQKKFPSTSTASSVSSGVAATPQIRNSLIIPSGEVTGSDTSDARSPLDRKAITDAFLAGMAAQAPKEVSPPVNNSLSDEQKLLQADKVDLLDAIAPTEALSHPSRIRPAKRRPPSSAFNKDGGLLLTFDEPSPSVNGTNGLAVQREESVEQADARSVSSGEMPQLPVTKTRTAPVKPPWMEELKRSQEKRGSTLVPAPSSSEEHNKSPVPPPTLKPTVPKVAPATPQPPSSHVNNKSTSPLTSRDSSESAKSAANLNTKTPSVGSSSSNQSSSAAGAADTYKMNLSNSNSSMNKQTSASSLLPGSRPGIPGEKPSVSPAAVKPAKSPTTTHIEAPKPSGPARPLPNSAIKSSSSTTNVPKSHITSDNNDNVQNEVESLRVRVGTLEATVEQLQASVQQLRQMLEEERKSRSANMLIHI